MKSTFEKLGGTYQHEGDYLLPNVEVPKSPAVGIWGERRRKYLREYQKPLYTAMLLGDTLNAHLEEVDRSATEMFDGDPDKPLHCQLQGKRKTNTRIMVAGDISPAMDSSTTGRYQVRQENSNYLLFATFLVTCEDAKAHM